jgi:mediator of RNA polymerase II transcription subunit 5
VKKLTQQSCKLRDKLLPAALFWSPAVVYAVKDLTGENMTAFAAWFKALFDSGSEGIEDTILRCVAWILYFVTSD